MVDFVDSVVRDVLSVIGNHSTVTHGRKIGICRAFTDTDFFSNLADIRGATVVPDKLLGEFKNLLHDFSTFNAHGKPPLG